MLEDILRAYAISFPEKWDACLKPAKFSYNNSYQESICMAPFEALYGKNVGHHLVGLKWETMDTLGQNSSRRLVSKSFVFRVI